MGKNKEIVNNIMAAILLIWFLASLIAIPILFAKNGYYGMMAFGQTLLSISILILITKNFVGIIFAFVGLLCTVLPYLMMKPDINGYIINWEAVIATLFVGAFVLVAPFLIFIPIIKYMKLKKRFTVDVEATIVEYHTMHFDEMDHSEEMKAYLPVYEFYFEAKKYKVVNSAYLEDYKKPLGTIVKFKINPDNPEEVIKQLRLNLVFVVMGMGFLMIALPILMLLIEKGDFVK